MKRFITTAIHYLGNGTKKSNSNVRGFNYTTEARTTGDSRTKETTGRSESQSQERVCIDRSKRKPEQVRERIRPRQRGILCGQFRSQSTKERWSTLRLSSFSFFSNLYPVLFSTTIDDYILLDKVQYAYQCLVSHSATVCGRGLGI
jgi:hypothetical protein